MFCNEKIVKVYIGVRENDDIYSHNAFLDCYHDIAYHCTEGYRIVLTTDNYAISLTANGVIKENLQQLCESPDEWLQDGIEFIEDDVLPFVSLESTLFVDERILSVEKKDNMFLVHFDDFLLKLIPHKNAESISELHNENHNAYNRVFGCDRHLKQKCPYCGGDGEILIDFVNDYVVRCKNCKKSTLASMDLICAIEDWNNSELHYDTSKITIE